ncbi:hypothetical protein NDU88_007842 [Pleurodeles waltl]|uniref:Uncharacterized protein n=1 Tax=Pleurodeles waltl TaxID=8319 RepID=A0AAV7QQ41_PLEWA|nr:hypothetical protein NDU88_007842 [Pleurodeles waltl]
MTDWAPFEEEEYGEYYKDGQFLGNGLSEAINASVQLTVRGALEASVPRQISQALVVALKPFMQQLETFAKTQCPQAKILEMALRAKESGASIDPHILAEWAQRAICLLGNANCAISSERRKSLLMRIDSNLLELVTADAGPLAEGRLFSDKFVKDIGPDYNFGGGG